jgi:hypothetical protein
LGIIPIAAQIPKAKTVPLIEVIVLMIEAPFHSASRLEALTLVFRGRHLALPRTEGSILAGDLIEALSAILEVEHSSTSYA